jgi:hypothetical protein
MSGAPNGNLQRVLPRKLDGRRNIVASCRLHDNSRTTVDHGVPNLAGLVVTGIVRA